MSDAHASRFFVLIWLSRIARDLLPYGCYSIVGESRRRRIDENEPFKRIDSLGRITCCNVAGCIWFISWKSAGTLICSKKTPWPHAETGFESHHIIVQYPKLKFRTLVVLRRCYFKLPGGVKWPR